MAGGFEVDMSAFPPKPSGRTGINGALVAPELADARLEAKRMALRAVRELTDALECLDESKDPDADSRLKAALFSVADARRYVETLRQPHAGAMCPSCGVAKTGGSVCEHCRLNGYGRKP
jgi:ribosomal protein L32